MSSKEKEKENKAFQQSMKQFFKQLNKGNIDVPNLKPPPEYILTEEIKKDLMPEAPLATRTKTIHSLCEIVESKRLEDYAIEKFWLWLKDLLSKDQPAEVRQLAFMFFTCLVKGQNERLELLRAHFFRVIKEYDHPEDIIQRFQLLQALTENGRSILTFEEEVGPFLLEWFEDIAHAGGIVEYLKLFLNVIKFNAAYVDEYVINKLVEHVCVLCHTTDDADIINACLNLLATIVAYSTLPRASLPNFIATLCKTVNGRNYSQLSWKIMRNLLGTDMGHRTLFTMCRLLEDPTLQHNTCLMKGAVFFINQGLWGRQPLPNLKSPLTAVVPAILTCAKYRHITVSYEIILAMQNVIESCHSKMHAAAWQMVFRVISVVVEQVESAPKQMPIPIVSEVLHKVLNKIEELIAENKFFGEFREFYDIIEMCAKSRPETSILRLISYLSQDIIATNHQWLTNLYSLMQKYFRNEIRTKIRLKTLDVLDRKVNLHRKQYEDELLDRIVIPHLININQDCDCQVRAAVANLLIELCMDCETKRCLEMLDILEKLLNRPFDQSNVDETNFADVDIVIVGLIKIFATKIHHLPSSHAIKVYKMLANHLDLHYMKPKNAEPLTQMRYYIFESFLKMRADDKYHLGYPDASDRMWYSSYLCVTYRKVDVASPPPPSPSPAATHIAPCVVTHLSMRHSFQVVINCLKHERDWSTLRLVLHEIPKVLQNKSLVLTKSGNNEVDLLVDALCGLIMDKARSSPENLIGNVIKIEFHSSVLLALAALASYHAYIDSAHQQKMIRCLYKHGFGARCSQQCITALTICTLEMKDVMVKVLPEALLILSKISATVHIAIPILEFLSMLTQLPTVFANFVADQYMAVFAISLPYTNPFKYNHYTVSLAHHVIAVWFLKCRLPFRKDFVRFITSGLQTNVLVPFHETSFPVSDLSKLNQDSSDRKRSSSLTEQSSRRRSATVGKDSKPVFDLHRAPPLDRNRLTFYEELTETCLDLMARYAFSPSCSAVPKRSPLAEFLLAGGQSMTWLLDNRLVTVTTSGCSQKALKNGVCDACWNVCKFEGVATTSRSSRSGSNDKDDVSGSGDRASRQNSDETSSGVVGEEEERGVIGERLLASLEGKAERSLCGCWCQGWAEIYVRRPTGDTSIMLRIQNQLQFQQFDFPLRELSSIVMSKLHHESLEIEGQSNLGEATEYNATSLPVTIPASPMKASLVRQKSNESVDEEEDVEYDDGNSSRNPVRRSNSSPEMSANWKNPFLQKQHSDDGRSTDDDVGKKVKNYSKDMRVSCEAIPEEIAGAGTTPPSTSQFQPNQPHQPTVNPTQAPPPPPPVDPSPHPHHPTLLSCHSYPGSHQPPESSIPSKPNRTVPPSPNVIQTSTNTPTFAAPRPASVSLLRAARSESLDATVTGKPPQSPTQTSPRLGRHASFKDGHDVKKSSSLVLAEKGAGVKGKVSLNQAEQGQQRDRGYTISVMSPARKPLLRQLPQQQQSQQQQQQQGKGKEAPKSGLHPSFVFLHLYYSAGFGQMKEKPLLVEFNQMVQRAVKVLDKIQPYETHKIGVIFIGNGQCNKEVEILKNLYGSRRYQEFLHTLGRLVRLEDANEPHYFLGGLEQNGGDGKFTYIWQDDVVKVAFHIATLMPNKESDPNCNNKKMHIGNNNVTIVYNESGEEYNINTLRGQFNFASIIIHPLDHNTNKVIVKGKDNLMELIGHSEPKIVSDQNLALLVRQLALHADLASMVLSSLEHSNQGPYASNWLERLRKIKNVRSKILQEEKNKEQQNPPMPDELSLRARRGQIVDFTEFT